MTITINGFDTASIDAAIRELQTKFKDQNQMVQDACMKVAEFGAKWAEGGYRSAEYPSGANDVVVTAEATGDGARVRASGENVLFIEYGAGALRGYGHPEPNGYGPGTFNPLSDNWKNPNGWYYAHGRKTWGNPPSAAMYYAEHAMRENADTIVNGVLGK